MQQRNLGTDVPIVTSGLMTGRYSGRRDPAPRVDPLRATVDHGFTFVDTADIHGRHADHEHVAETRTALATKQHGTAPTLQIRPFPRVQS
jgi:aryl-alcohol dehydrogenase-like predicted oxidoreductase